MRIISVLGVLVIAVVAGAVLVAYAGCYDVSAREAHTAPVGWFLSVVTHNSVERRATGIEVPNLEDESLVRAGISDYDAMCAGCHGAPGRERNAVGNGLMPRPPDFAHAAGHMSAAELFWVTKNGIRMTGMPAWGETHDDDDLWPIVAFLMRLPEFDAAAYGELLASGSDSGHHRGEEMEEERDSRNHGGHEH